MAAEQPPSPDTAVILVDHGSRRPAANELLDRVVDLFRAHSGYAIVEAAHMELAEPTLAQAMARCARAGARRVVVAPYFLAPGRHGDEDIPSLAHAAAAEHPGLRCVVAEPLGPHPLMAEIINQRVGDAVRGL